MGGYDLYGNYYPKALDALNAEMAQCAEIDARIASQKVHQLERQMQQRSEPSDTDYQLHHLWTKIQELETRLKKYEKQNHKHRGKTFRRKHHNN